MSSRLAAVETSTAWVDGRAPAPDEVYTPWSHERVINLDRTLVVGNRGVGKTFWSNALVDAEARKVAQAAYPKNQLETISDAAFGFQGGIASDRTPAKETLQQALNANIKPETIWLAVALRALGGVASKDLPKKFLDAVRHVENDPEDAHLRLRTFAAAQSSSGRRFLLVFDALDRIGDNWDEIRPLTEGLFRFAVSVRGVRGLTLKIFVRPDQLLDPRVFAFPDASKLLSERVDLRWRSQDLYGLLFFHLWRFADSKKVLISIAKEKNQLWTVSGGFPFVLRFSESIQKHLFTVIAGEWMGANKKRGSTFTWLPQHLADASNETSPRSFLKAVSVAASMEVRIAERAIDYVGIKEGVVAASEVRIQELQEDYWWIQRALRPLRGITVPCEQEVLLDRWREDHTGSAIRREAAGLLPILFDVKGKKADDSMALLLTLKEIAVIEIRSNLKVNFPDIFRVGAGINGEVVLLRQRRITPRILAKR